MKWVKWGAALMAIALPFNVAAAADLVATRQVILKDERNGALMIEPRSILRMEDGGFLVSGHIFATQSAWAVRTDAEGKAIWRYDVNIRDELPRGQGAVFNSATVVPDGSAYFCGSMPRPADTSSPGLLVHVDAAGRPLSERLLTPSDPLGAEVSLSYFEQCLRWGAGTAIIGRTVLFHRIVPDRAERRSNEYYWIVMLNGSGEVVSEKLIPTSLPQGVIEDVESAQIESDGSLLLIGHRTSESELLRIGRNGEVLVRKSLLGGYHIVKAVLADDRLQVFGGDHELLTLDSQLGVIAQKSGRHLSAFVTHDAYRLPDESLVLFGSTGDSPHSRATWVSATLDSERHIDFEKRSESDGGFVAAAAIANSPREFITARKLFKRIPSERAGSGAALDFVQVK
jgi:hypothetical protein